MTCQYTERRCIITSIPKAKTTSLRRFAYSCPQTPMPAVRGSPDPCTAFRPICCARVSRPRTAFRPICCARVSRPRTAFRPKVSRTGRAVCRFGRPTVSNSGEVGRPAPSATSSGEVGRPAPSAEQRASYRSGSHASWANISSSLALSRCPSGLCVRGPGRRRRTWRR
jgi:hypothetical protein